MSDAPQSPLSEGTPATPVAPAERPTSPVSVAPPQRPFQFGLWALLIGMTVAGAVLGVAGILVKRGIERSREIESMNNLKQIGIAMHNYHDVFRGMPTHASYDSTGQPLLRWRVHILPFIEYDNLYKQFHLNEPWDSPHNRTLIAQMPKVYESPVSRPGINVPPGMTCYLVPVGAGTIFPKREMVPPGEQSKFESQMPIGTSLLQIRDGSANTILVLEAAPQRAVVWTKPDDFEFAEEAPMAGLVGHRVGGFFAMMADGSVHRIPEFSLPHNVRRLFLRDDGEFVNLETLEVAK